MANVNYNRHSDTSFKAWIEYCRSDDAMQNEFHVQTFNAGFNAAMAVPSIIMTPERLEFLQRFRDNFAAMLTVYGNEGFETEYKTELLNEFDALIANAEDELSS